MSNVTPPTPITIERAIEQLRQERETFNQVKRHESRWFILSLAMGYSAIGLLAMIIIIASLILFNPNLFPSSVVIAAGAALFVDVLGLLVTVWKITFNPDFSARLRPVTAVEWPVNDEILSRAESTSSNT